MTGHRVLVIGASGQLGAAVSQVFADHVVEAPSHATLDLTDADSVHRVVQAFAPSVIVNCAAFNDVDGAEDRPVEAFDLNTFGVRSLARAAAACGATLVHYGSDFVFDGEGESPYTEDVPPSPRSVYAMSKLAGEWMALEAPRAFVLRVESLFGTPPDWTGRRGTLDAITAGLEAGRSVRVFADRVVSPSHVGDVAAATKHLVSSGAAPGLYHCVNTGHATWLEVAVEAARLLEVAPILDSISQSQVPMKAARPRYCALSNRKLAAAGFSMPTWQDALARWLAARRRSIE